MDAFKTVLPKYLDNDYQLVNIKNTKLISKRV